MKIKQVTYKGITGNDQEWAEFEYKKDGQWFNVLINKIDRRVIQQPHQKTKKTKDAALTQEEILFLLRHRVKPSIKRPAAAAV